MKLKNYKTLMLFSISLLSFNSFASEGDLNTCLDEGGKDNIFLNYNSFVDCLSRVDYTLSNSENSCLLKSIRDDDDGSLIVNKNYFETCRKEIDDGDEGVGFDIAQDIVREYHEYSVSCALSDRVDLNDNIDDIIPSIQLCITDKVFDAKSEEFLNHQEKRDLLRVTIVNVHHLYNDCIKRKYGVRGEKNEEFFYNAVDGCFKDRIYPDYMISVD